MALVAAATVILIAAGALFVWTRVRSMPDGRPAPVVGILPFRNATGDAPNDAIAAGLTEAVGNRLRSVRALRVLPPDEVRDALKSKASTNVARVLGASFVVDGAVDRSGDTLDVSVQLLSEDGLTRPIGRYSGNLAHLFDLHKRVADALAGALSTQGVIESTSQPAAAPPTSNVDAFTEYSQARVFLERPDVAGSLDTSIRLLQSAITRDPGFALAYAALGEVYWAKWRETNDPEWTTKAQAANLEALRIDPAQPEVRMALAVMYQGIGQADKAVAELRKVLGQQPRNDSAHLVLARIAADKGQWDEAIAEARTAIDLRPTYWRNHLQLGDALYRAGRFEAAVTAFNRLIELQPDSSRGHQRLGNTLQAMGRNDEALQAYEAATRIAPTPATYSNMATIYYWRGDYGRARDVYERALALSPNNSDLHANLGDVLLKLGYRQRAMQSYHRAVEEVSKALSVNDNDPLRVASLALYRAKLGERARAADVIARAIRLSPEDGDVLYTAAMVYALAPDTAAACVRIGQAIEHGKNNEEIRHSDELKSLKGCPAYDGVLASAR